jgi:hypothetical protein
MKPRKQGLPIDINDGSAIKMKKAREPWLLTYTQQHMVIVIVLIGCARIGDFGFLEEPFTAVAE